MKEWLEKYRKIQTLFFYIKKIPSESEIEKKKEISKKFWQFENIIYFNF